MAISFVTNTFPIVKSGVFFQYDILTAGAIGAVTPSLTVGSLPNGLAFVAHPTDNKIVRVEGLPNDDYRHAFSIQITDGATNATQSFVAYCTPPLDTSKPLLVLAGDSITQATAVGDVTTESLKPNIVRLLGNYLDICQFGFSGFQVLGVDSQFSAYADLVYSALRPKKYYSIQGGANDIQVDSAGSNTLDGAGLASHFQTALNTAKAKGYSTILNTVMAWDGSGVDEPLRLAGNIILRGGGMTNRDLLCDIGGQTKFNSLAACADTKYYFSDKVHLVRLGYKLWAQAIVATIGADPGNDLLSVWDFNEEIFVAGENYVPVNIPFGGTGAKTYAWFIDNVAFSTSQNPNFNFTTGGTKSIRLEVTTVADGMVSFTRSLFVALAGDVGGGLITPSSANVAEDGFIDLVSSNVTSPIWRKRQGSGGITNPDSNPVHRRYTDANPHAPGLIEAAEDIYDGAPGGGSVDSNQDWNQTVVGSPTAVYKPRLTAVGDWIEATIPIRFAGNSTIGLYEQATGNRWHIKPDGKVYQIIGGSTTVENPRNLSVGVVNGSPSITSVGLFQPSDVGKAFVPVTGGYSVPPGTIVQTYTNSNSVLLSNPVTGTTGTISADLVENWLANDKIRFKIVDVAGVQKIQVIKNGTPIVTCAGTKNSGFYVYLVIYSEDTIGQTPSANIKYLRPDANGQGVGNWRAGTSAITPIAAPVAGFTIPATLLAGEPLTITDTSSHCDSYEWRITNSKYTNQLVAADTNPTPNLNAFLRMGNNRIDQKGINSTGFTTVFDEVVVNEQLISRTVEYADLTGVAIGQTLVGDVEGFDTNGNHSGYSTTNEITVA